MPKKLYYIVTLLILVGMVGLVGAQITGTKSADTAVTAAKEKGKTVTIEERIAEIEKNQKKILAELKEIKESQAKILEETKKIYTNMKRK